jgi:hypothetical protein
MASKKNNPTSRILSRVNLTPTDKLALATQFMDDGFDELLTDYAVKLTQSPFMMRYLKDAAETIARDPDRENALALRLAELHFAERMVVSC